MRLSTRGTRGTFAIGLLMLVLVGLAACNAGGEATTTLPYSLDPVQAPKWYEDIKLGMTYDEVVHIAGFEGTLVEDAEHSTEETVHQWSSSDPWIVTVVLTNGRVTWKAFRAPG